MSLLVRSPLVRVGLVAASVAAVAAGAMTSTGSLLVVAVLLLLPIATSLSQAGRLAAALQGMKRRAINAVVWGVPIGRPAAAGMRVVSVGAVGAGLLIYLMDAGEAKTLLKVAQPRSWQVENDRVVIGDAAYVQWAGKRLARADGVPAVAIESPASRDA
jgi:hypothetical protein